MKAKLIKDHSNYHLVNDTNFIIGTTDEGMLSCTDKRKLSLKNCQSIERGYDLDELAHIRAEILNSYTSGTKWADEIDKLLTRYREVIELMGDKKYSEEDVRNAYFNGEKDSYVKGGQTKEMQDEFIQSLQQTEWEVEVEMVKIEPYKDKMGNVRTEKTFPTLDADGCLILKLKS